MSSGADFDYSQKKKRDWRGWVWNRIVERLPCRPQDAVVVGFFGAEAYDVREAEKRGFRRENLISIERNRSAAEQSRRNGANVFHGECDDFVRAWDASVAVDAVLLDFCGSMTHRQLATAREIAHWPALKRWGVIAVNLLAGHEKQLSLLHKVTHSCGLERFQWHRGAMFQSAVNRFGISAVSQITGLGEPEVEKRMAELVLCDAPRFVLHPAPFSYRSRVGPKQVNRFDSVVFNRLIEFGEGLDSHYERNEARLSIAALRAWRTRRLAAR